MSEPLFDLKRLKVTRATKAWLQAEAHATGRTQQEIAREVLHQVAVEKIRAARVLLSMAPAESLMGDPQALGGDARGWRNGRAKC